MLGESRFGRGAEGDEDERGQDGVEEGDASHSCRVTSMYDG